MILDRESVPKSDIISITIKHSDKGDRIFSLKTFLNIAIFILIFTLILSVLISLYSLNLIVAHK